MRFRRRTPRKKGQALVEFTLASTLIFMLLSATVDIGLMFFTLQALRTAAQEGATFGSYTQVTTSGGSITGVNYRYEDIYERVRTSAGAPRSNGIVNFFDLNNNGVPDASERNAIFNASDPANPNGFVIIENLQGVPGSWAPTPCETNRAGEGLMANLPNCYLRVTVRYNYDVFFPLMPAFGDTVTLQARFTIKARNSFSAVPNP
jgi:Flp pilus assembly protein TadG